MAVDSGLQAWALLCARLCVATLYLVSAVRQVRYRAPVMAEMARHGLPWPRPMLACAVLLELLCGISIVLGPGSAPSAFALIAFTLVSTLVYYRDFRDREQLLHAMKNLAIIGGLLMIGTIGPGRLVIAG